MQNSEYFELEIGWIKNEGLKKFANKYVDLFPPYFAEKPSSSTGKYHAPWSNLPGGLRAHTRVVAYWVKELGAAYGVEGDALDVAIIVAIGHDAIKYGFEGGKYTTKTHEEEGAVFFKKVVEKLCGGDVTKFPHYNDAYEALAYHQGRWAATEPKKKFPEEFSRIAQLVHVADMCGSRRDPIYPFLESAMVG